MDDFVPAAVDAESGVGAGVAAAGQLQPWVNGCHGSLIGAAVCLIPCSDSRRLVKAARCPGRVRVSCKAMT